MKGKILNSKESVLAIGSPETGGFSAYQKYADTAIKLISTGDYPHAYGFDYFNPVQSSVYHHRANPNNMIIAANTSAGKTIAAELLIDATLQKNQRVIYLSPLKALTEEKYSEWKNRYPDQSIVILTGDHELSPEVYEKLWASRIIVMTSEMMDSRTRKFHSEKNYWMNEVGLVIVDEAHILTTSRGDAVETSLMRFTSHCPGARILFLSATMPNVKSLGYWLTSLNRKETDIIQLNWRPVELQIHCVEYLDVIKQNGHFDYWATEYKKIQIAMKLVLSKPDEKFLVFVHSKKIGYLLLKQLKEFGVHANFHNADLDHRERREIEKSFADQENGIRVLVSTSTTAWGVNLPARNVVIVGIHRGFNDVDELDIIQMAGRAGRYGIDDEGHVFLVLPYGSSNLWQDIFNNPRPVTSVLNNRRKLTFHVLAEIYRKVIKTEPDLFNWYERSLAFRQGIRPFSKKEAKEVLQELKRMNMIYEKEFHLQTTRLGIISAIMYYPPKDIYAWYKNFRSLFSNNLPYDDITMAWALGNIPSNKSYIPKDFEPLKNDWRCKLKRFYFQFDIDTVLHIEATYNCLKRIKAKGRIQSKMRGIRSDAQRMINTLRMIDKTYAFWNKDLIWESLESKLAP